MSPHTPLGGGGEFDLIRAMISRWRHAAAGIGDDAAILDVPAGERLVVSTDASIESFHFRRDWLTAEEIGWRATMAALSDLAAMAARPIGMLVSMSLPDHWRHDALAVAEGIGAAAHEGGCLIVGGDTTRATALSLAITVLGAAKVPVTRSGARAGDGVYVTGALGGAGTALDALAHGRTPTPAQRERFARPRARLRESLWLSDHGMSAAIDVSDGLLADLGHIAAASGVSIDVDLDALPLIAGTSPERAAWSGEEYELAVTAPSPLDARAFEERFGLPLTRIGSVRAKEDGASVTARREGRVVDLPRGHDHFSR